MPNFDFSPLQARYPDQFRADEALARYTVARLGGPADGLLRVKSLDDLIWAAHWAHDSGIPWLVLGGGANVLASDAGYHGLVIINHCRANEIDPQSGLVIAESGTNLSSLARLCMAEGVAGLEWAVSVPGTLGGAIVNNAGAHDGDMAACLLSAQILDLHQPANSAERLQDWPLSALAYAYRHSSLKGERGRYVVLSGRLALQAGADPASLNAKADDFIAHRKRTQPPGASLGSMFKNPEGDYAGRLIEAAGLKGYQIGGVQISPVHANFFINLGGGTAADYQALIAHAQQSVYEQFGVMLSLEIEQIGFDSP